MLIKDVMKKDVITIPSYMSFLDAIHTFIQNNLSGAPVVDQQGTVIGFVTEKDLLRAFYPTYQEYYGAPTSFLTSNLFFDKLDEYTKQPVTDIMNTRLLLTTSHNPIRYVGGKMVATGIHQAPVIDDGKLVGIVGRRDIYRALVNEHLQINVRAQIYVDTNNSFS